MKRMLPPSGAAIETSIPRPGGGESIYRMQKDGTVHVSDADAKTLRKAGYTEASAGGWVQAAGWVCDDCGFHGFFRRCGRCGGENTRKP